MTNPSFITLVSMKVLKTAPILRNKATNQAKDDLNWISNSRKNVF